MNNDFNKIDKNIVDAARRGDTNAVLKNLNECDRQKVQEILADKDKLKQLLNSEEAQNLIKFLGGKRNG